MRRWRRRLRNLLLGLVLAPVLAVLTLTLVYRVVQPPLTTLQAIRLAQGYGFARDVRPLSALGRHLPRAVIASEDNRFCEHRGIDWEAFRQEMHRWQDGERPRGASTLSMQTTRNLFLWPDRGYGRKALELALAPLIDALLPKRRIMEIYLNQVEFAPGVYGAEAAAQHHFGKHAAQLDPWEAARLVALLPAPLSRQPDDAVVARQAQRIVDRTGTLGPYFDCVVDDEAVQPR